LIVPKLGDGLPKLGENHGELDENHGEVDENRGTFGVKAAEVDATVREMRDYSLDDLAALSGYSARGIRHYIQLGLLTRPKNAARATRYSRETLGRLAAIRHSRDQEGRSVNQVRVSLIVITHSARS
jgi:hypothetical protein